MMKLYHGSLIEVKNPRILTSARTGDFGQGFYTTSCLQQARRWASIRAQQEEACSGMVTVFDAPDILLSNSELRIKTFAKADDSWLDFVLNNRRQPGFDHKFDIVAGPVADDRVYVCLNALESGFADRQTVITQLKTFVLADQILFHTAKSLLFLKHIDSEAVPCKLK